MSNPRYSYDFDPNLEWLEDLPYKGLFGDADGFRGMHQKTFTPWICVDGYETSISTDEIKELLTKHFKDCGTITDLCIPSDNKRYAYIFLAGEGAVQRALDLAGTEVGGRKIDVFISIIPRNKTVTDDGPYDIPRNNTVTDCGPYGYTHPGQRVVAEPKSFPLPTFGCSPFSEFAEVGSAKRALEQSGSDVGGRKIAAYVSDTPRNNTITVPAHCLNKVEKMTEE